MRFVSLVARRLLTWSQRYDWSPWRRVPCLEPSLSHQLPPSGAGTPVERTHANGAARSLQGWIGGPRRSLHQLLERRMAASWALRSSPAGSATERAASSGWPTCAYNSMRCRQHQVRYMATEPWSCVARLDAKDIRSEHEQEVQRLRVLLQEVKSAYPQESRTLQGAMRARVAATLYEASKLVDTLSNQLQSSAEQLLSFEQLAEVYRTHDALLDLGSGLRAAVPVEAFPPGMVPVAKLEEKRRLRKRDRILAEQESEAALQERIFRELHGQDVSSAEDTGSGGYAEWYEKSVEPRTLLRGFHTVLLDMRRVAKVTKGSTRLSFRAAVCIGNGKGIGGYGDGKARTIQGAVARATREARRNLIYVPLHRQQTVPHAVSARFGRCLVYLWPLGPNAGLRMNYFYQCALDVIGVKNAGAKLHGSRNRINALKALFEALKGLHDPAEIAASRGYRVLDLSAYIEGKLQSALMSQ